MFYYFLVCTNVGTFVCTDLTCKINVQIIQHPTDKGGGEEGVRVKFSIVLQLFNFNMDNKSAVRYFICDPYINEEKSSDNLLSLACKINF